MSSERIQGRLMRAGLDEEEIYAYSAPPDPLAGFKGAYF